MPCGSSTSICEIAWLSSAPPALTVMRPLFHHTSARPSPDATRYGLVTVSVSGGMAVLSEGCANSFRADGSAELGPGIRARSHRRTLPGGDSAKRVAVRHGGRLSNRVYGTVRRKTSAGFALIC